MNEKTEQEIIVDVENYYKSMPDKPISQHFSEFTGETAEKILKDSELLPKVLKEACKKVVGEYKTVLALFLCGCGIWVENLNGMLNCFVNAESSAGKDYVTKAVYDLFPKDRKEYRTKITLEYLTYMHNSQYEPEWTWDGKIFYLADIRANVLNSPAFKVMCSEGSYAGVVKDQKAFDILIKGKPIFFVTTATANPKTETLNRFLSITLDETAEQTRLIMEKQGEEEEKGEIDKYDEKLLEALTHLKRVKVRVPYATRIHKNLSAGSLRMRRYHKVTLDLIKCSVALHQYQREEDEKGNYLATEQDYEIMRTAMAKIEIEKPQLTHLLKKAYENCIRYAQEHLKDSGEGEPEKKARFTAQEIFVYSMKDLPVTLQMWYRYLKELVGYGLLNAQNEKREGSDKSVVTYYPIELMFTSLPEFDNL